MPVPLNLPVILIVLWTFSTKLLYQTLSLQEFLLIEW
jgi:hypothetical protein